MSLNDAATTQSGVKVFVGVHTTFEDIVQTCTRRNILFFETARNIFRKCPLAQPQTELYLSVCSVSQLVDSQAATRDIFSALETRGARMCPVEVAVAFILMHKALLKTLFYDHGMAQRGLNLYMSLIGKDPNSLAIISIGFTVAGNAFIAERSATTHTFWRPNDLFVYVEPSLEEEPSADS